MSSRTGCFIRVGDLDLTTLSFTASGFSELRQQNLSFGRGETVSFTCPVGSTLLSDGTAVQDGIFAVDCPLERAPNEPLFTALPIPLLTCQANVGPGIMGEPHIKKWNGAWYDWHGECDAVFLQAPDFQRDLGLDIHTRTKIRYDYSYIETAALRIGPDILEISSFGEYIFNGIAKAVMPQIMGDCCMVTHNHNNEKQHTFSIDLGDGASSLEFTTHKDIVSVKILHQESPMMAQWFGSSSGLMGSFDKGITLARDGVTVLEHPNELGQEWQVLDSDPKLFQDKDRSPQFPEKCHLPDPAASAAKRRLLGDVVSRDEAAKACAHWRDDERENCIADVMATSDLELADFDGY